MCLHLPPYSIPTPSFYFSQKQVGLAPTSCQTTVFLNSLPPCLALEDMPKLPFLYQWQIFINAHHQCSFQSLSYYHRSFNKMPNNTFQKCWSLIHLLQENLQQIAREAMATGSNLSTPTSPATPLSIQFCPSEIIFLGSLSWQSSVLLHSGTRSLSHLGQATVGRLAALRIIALSTTVELSQQGIAHFSGPTQCREDFFLFSPAWSSCCSSHTQKSKETVQQQKWGAKSLKLGRKEERTSQHLSHCFLSQCMNNKLMEIFKPLFLSQIFPLGDGGK